MDKYNVLMALSLLSFVFFSYFVHLGLLGAIDDSCLDIMVSQESGAFVALFRVITYLGSVLLLFPLTFAIFLLTRKRLWKQVMRIGGALVFSTILVNLLKLAFRIDRPTSPLLASPIYSYPSGHACLSIIFFCGLSLIFYKEGIIRRNYAILISIIMSILVSFSRIYLRVHYLSDIFGSLLLAIFIISLFFSDYIRNTN